MCDILLFQDNSGLVIFGMPWNLKTRSPLFSSPCTGYCVFSKSQLLLDERETCTSGIDNCPASYSVRQRTV